MIDDATRKAVELIIGPYSWGVVQDMAHLYVELRVNGIEWEDLIRYVAEKQLERRNMEMEYHKRKAERAAAYKELTKRCEVCGNPMNIYPVNHQPCAMVGGEYRSMWICSDFVNCGETVYSVSDMRTEMEKYGLDKIFTPAREAKRSDRRRRQLPPPSSHRR